MLAFILFGVMLLLYSLTMCPGISLSDSGELATVCSTLGIAHPTGYPLYTLLGKIIVEFFPFYPPALATNFLSALFSAIAVASLTLFLREVGVSKTYSLLGGFIFGIGEVLWSQAVITEVYTLSSAVQWLSMTSLARWWRTRNPRFLFLASYLFGLAFTNHMSAILFLPAVALVLWNCRKSIDIKQLITSKILFLLGISLYLYLPIRSAQNPVLNWGAPSSLWRLWKHLSGWQYHIWMFKKDTWALTFSFKQGLATFAENWGAILLIICCAGMVFALSKNKTRFWATVLLVLICSDVVYSLNYSIPDIAPYYLPSLGAFACLLSLGLSQAFQKKPVLAVVTTSFLWVLTAIVTIANFRKCDLSNDWSGEEFGENIFTFIPANSLIITQIWDTYSIGLYFQQCKGISPSCKLVDILLLKRSWYVEQTILKDSKVSSYVIPYAQEFLKNVANFEHGKKYNGNMIQRAYENMIYSLAESWNGDVLTQLYEKPFSNRFYGQPSGFFNNTKKMTPRCFPIGLWQISSTVEQKKRWNDRQKGVFPPSYGFAFLSQLRSCANLGDEKNSTAYNETAKIFREK